MPIFRVLVATALATMAVPLQGQTCEYWAQSLGVVPGTMIAPALDRDLPPCAVSARGGGGSTAATTAAAAGPAHAVARVGEHI